MSRNLLRIPVLGLCAMSIILLACPRIADADLLYSQPWDGTDSAYGSQNDPIGFGQFVTAFDNFTVNSPGLVATVTTVTWTGEYLISGSDPIQAFTLSFFANAAGGIPGDLIASEMLTGNAGETPFAVSNGTNLYRYSQTIAPVSLDIGRQYWLSIESTLSLPTQWGWAMGNGGDGASYQSLFGLGAAQPGDLAFTLNGVTSSVPEPGSIVIVCLGLAGIGAFRSVKKPNNVAP